MKSRVLITGGAGFLGFALGKHLAQHNYEVTLVDNLARGVKDTALTDAVSRGVLKFEEVDLLDPECRQNLGGQYEFIFHLAAIIGVAHVMEKPYEVLRDNVALLTNTLSFAKRQKNLKRFLFASTSEVYAGTLKNFSLPIPTPEETPLALTELSDVRTSYMLSKIYGEALCLHSGLPITVFRPHNVYGPRMGLAHIIPEQLKKAHEARSGSIIPVPSADHRRCFLYIDDAVEMLKSMMERPQCQGETLNLGQNMEEVTVKHVAQLCWETVGKELLMERVAATQGSPVRRVPEVEKLASLTDCCATTTLRRGVEETYRWYRSHVFNDADISAA